jgi:hypothetical protein
MPTAMSTTLPRMANSLNSLIIRLPPSWTLWAAGWAAPVW